MRKHQQYHFSGLCFGLLVLLAFFIASCSSQGSYKRGENELAFIDILNPSDVAKYDKGFFQDIRVIPLETNDSVLMAGCDKVIHHENRYYVLDKRFSNLFIFDEQGKYLERIGKLGNGPGEYQSIYGFDIIESEQKVIVYSLENMALFEYSLMGDFIQKIDIDFYGYDFMAIDEDQYVFNLRYNYNGKYDYYNLLFTNNKGKVMDKAITYPEEATEVVMGFTGFLEKGRGNDGYYANAMSDTVYHIDFATKTVSPKLVVDFGKESWPYGFDYVKIQGPDALNYSYLSHEFFTRGDRLFFGFFDKERRGEKHGLTPKMAIFDLAKGRLLTTDNMSDEFLFKYGVGIPQGFGLKGDYIASISLKEIDLIERNYPKAWEAAQINYPETYEILVKLKEEDNPALLLYKLSNDHEEVSGQ